MVRGQAPLILPQLPPPHPARGVAGEKVNMTTERILSSLETLTLTGDEADAAARLGFLEWALAGPDDVTASTLSAALQLPEARNPESAAAQAFVGFLQEAQMGFTRPKRRSRRLH